MKQLPAAYEEYLQDKDEAFIATIRPILQQSTADGREGVRVVMDPGVLQAHLDDSIPFGQIVEDVD
ncbi:hypothetical protein AL755_12770 [Arthrobacter sp. ERGS1:01]|uniref:hypothetical protein n=1 Tax=Arthrobacter sp. ERGS1:01 TaxID=1704044 RepID=UPI0006B3FD4D|nr:hypothetical protein [Arthrobacter sp. ERGS1:01]ALE06139.1 hypothetical protein AL755_12770 [Arthrobacter sp. ERGS1:01]